MVAVSPLYNLLAAHGYCQGEYRVHLTAPAPPTNIPVTSPTSPVTPALILMILSPMILLFILLFLCFSCSSCFTPVPNPPGDGSLGSVPDPEQPALRSCQ